MYIKLRERERERKESKKEKVNPTSDWPAGKSVDIFLIDNWYGNVQPTPEKVYIKNKLK